ncbi:histidine triad nucleotide-binding protein [Kiloniella laminariae]|uniref:histidine triad nucleotide-binding protein n=1 Tax=Kiloniella laminariae TaxID=454162 RepID=UPI000360923D|nr:histidine triad nucleotide-binding protein [Kiloniella laminariae]
MAYDSNNIFAKILRGEIPCTKVFENEHVFAFNDIAPKAPVHVLIIPKGAYVSFADFSAKATAEEIVALNRAVGEIAREKGIDVTGYRLLANHAEHARQDVPHYHVHLLGGVDLGPCF